MADDLVHADEYRAEIDRLHAVLAVRDEELEDAEAEIQRMREQRDAVLRGEHVPLADLEATWRVGAEHKKRADEAKWKLDAVRARLRELHQRYVAENSRVVQANHRADAAERKLAEKVALLAEAVRKLAVIRELHRPYDRVPSHRYCRDCERRWLCPTARILDTGDTDAR